MRKFCCTGQSKALSEHFLIRCVLAHLSTVDSQSVTEPPYPPILTQLILLSCSQLREYLLQLLLYFSFFFFFPFIWADALSQRQKSLILQTHSKPNSGRPYLRKNKTKLCLPEVHSGKTAVSVCFVLVPHCHKCAELHCLVLNLS